MLVFVQTSKIDAADGESGNANGLVDDESGGGGVVVEDGANTTMNIAASSNQEPPLFSPTYKLSYSSLFILNGVFL